MAQALTKDQWLRPLYPDNINSPFTLSPKLLDSLFFISYFASSHTASNLLL
jgi:hypothetical protein